MWPVAAQSLLLATAGLMSPGSITLVILLLISERGSRNGLAYAMGYTGGYGLIGVAVVALGYSATRAASAQPSPAIALLLLALGALLVSVAVRNWRKPPAAERQPPRFLSVVDNITPLKALGMGALVTVMNFKNLALFLTALSVIIVSDLPQEQQLVIALVAALVFCLSVILPVLIYLLFPSRSTAILSSFRRALEGHSRAIAIWLPLIFGLIFLTRAVSLLE